METWLSGNWLALYGAVVGTIALTLNFMKYRHDVKAREIDLRVSYVKSSSYEKNIAALKRPASDKPWEGGSPSVVDVYVVEIINSGSIDAFIRSAGVVTSFEERKEALVGQPSNSLILQPISQRKGITIPPKSAEKYRIYLNRGEEPFEVAYAFAVDETGVEWKSKGAWRWLLSRQVSRTMPRIKL